jgi:hypothetical protein
MELGLGRRFDMQQQRLKAYLNLIQELLTCPSGEEWIRLRQHETLVDAGLVQTMEQVATTLAQEGKEQEAIFLHNWAGKLHHILAQSTQVPPQQDTTAAYLDFIQALLAATPQERQHLIATHQHLVTPGLVHLMRQISAQLAAQGETATATYLQDLAKEMGKLWLQSHSFEPPTPGSAAVSSPTEPAAQSRFKPVPQKSSEQPVTRQAEPGQEAVQSQESNGAPQSRVSLTSPELPDPWLDTPAIATVAAPNSDTTTLSTPAVALSADQPERFPWEKIETQLATIATALTALNERLAESKTPQNPLWHLEALEQAYQAGWVLTTDEVASLLQVRPKCSAEETVFERGCWRLVKTGKLGSQTGWRVEKVTGNSSGMNSE